jgi:alpha-galactosidase
MSTAEVAVCLATGLLGRFYVSGYLNRMDEPRLALVRDAVALAKQLAPEIRTSTPFWPLGLPSWEDPWTALGLQVAHSRLVTVWNRSVESDTTGLRFPALSGSEVRIHTLFPRTEPEWPTRWDPQTGTMHIRNPTGEVGARVLRIEVIEP